MSKERFGTVYVVVYWMAYDGRWNRFATLDKSKAEKYKEDHDKTLRESPEPVEGYYIEEMELQ